MSEGINLSRQVLQRSSRSVNGAPSTFDTQSLVRNDQNSSASRCQSNSTVFLIAWLQRIWIHLSERLLWRYHRHIISGRFPIGVSWTINSVMFSSKNNCLIATCSQQALWISSVETKQKNVPIFANKPWPWPLGNIKYWVQMGTANMGEQPAHRNMWSATGHLASSFP